MDIAIDDVRKLVESYEASRSVLKTNLLFMTFAESVAVDAERKLYDRIIEDLKNLLV